jgi:hypothetical protein
MHNSIFITYNPDSELERTLAVRLHTIGAVNGFQMYLPDRYDSVGSVSQETRHRIASAYWFILFSTHTLSSVVREEIRFAIEYSHDPTRIIVVYGLPGARPELNGLSEITQIPFDPWQESIDQVAGKILDTISHRMRHEPMQQWDEQNNSERNGLAALIGIGLGLFALSLLGEEEKPVAKKRSRRK